MKTQNILSLIVLLFFAACTQESQNEKQQDMRVIEKEMINETIDSLHTAYPEYKTIASRGASQVAVLWRETDGSPEDYHAFCKEEFIANDNERLIALKKAEHYFEILHGYFHRMDVELQENLHLDRGTLHDLDYRFGAYDASAHLIEDLFRNKTAFKLLLNFPAYNLEEKMNKSQDWSRQKWAEARLGDMFVARVPADLQQAASEAATKADTYISEYNIYMGQLRDENGEQLFPEGLKLISHWGLRDELKSHYGTGEQDKQEMIYQVMLRIIHQEIPEKVINNPEYRWKPNSNELLKEDRAQEFEREADTRYGHLLNNFHAHSAMDTYHPLYPDYVKRAFSQGMEISQPEVEELFRGFISDPVVKEVAALIKERLDRDLRPYDIWYDGFKARTGIPETKLNAITREKYPGRHAFKADMPRMLQELGWNEEEAKFIASKISVDPARGAGHAWGAEMHSDVSHLRTRLPEKGMSYKGYNIAVHEFGHNVEQTITLHHMDHYFMHGVPNTAFTEAVAFMFQSQDLDLLGISEDNAGGDALKTLDNFWSAYEIMGVSLVDMEVWKWMYAHPEAEAAELREAVIDIAKDVWNSYYADVFGIADSPILAIYSHMIDAPLYLSNYPLGHLVEFQMEAYMQDKEFDKVLTHALEGGRLIPQTWMKRAVGEEISGEALIEATAKAVDEMQD